MNKLTALISACAMLAPGIGDALGQGHAGGHHGHDRWHGGAGWSRHHFGPYGGWSYIPAYPYVYRIAPYPGYYYPYGPYVPPVAGYTARRYYAYSAYNPPVYMTQGHAYAAPPVPPPPPAPAPRLDRYTLSAKELFEFDRSELRSPQPKLDEIAAVLTSNPQIGLVNIAGYTDRLGSDAHNLKLSQRRADAVKIYLVSKGVAANRLIAVGRGKGNPIVQCRDTAREALIKCLEPNRRVEVEQFTVDRSD